MDPTDSMSDEYTDSFDYITAEFRRFMLEWDETGWFDDLEDCTERAEDDDDDSDEDNDNVVGTEEAKTIEIRNKIGSWATLNSIPDIKINPLLVLLREAGLTYLPKDIRGLRKTPKATEILPCSPGEYFHYGLQTAMKDVILKYNFKIEKQIVIDINIDGLPICKSPPLSLWSILERVVDKSCSEVFIIGVYRGKAKPESPSIYLENFIIEYLHLHDQGFTFKGVHFTVKITCLICDSPAASFVLCIKQFNGYYGCRKCTVKGSWKSCAVLLQEHEPLRTNISFRNRSQEQHHNGISPFERLEFDMVQQVPLDYMHLVCLGVTKLLIRLWIKPRTNASVNIIQLEQISVNFLSLTPWIPKEFARKPQAILELKNWKATTFRLFLNYGGPIILLNVLPKEYLEHFNVLHCAIRILSDSTKCLLYNVYAKELLIYFVGQFKNLYGEHTVTWNVHNLSHLADDAKEHGPLDAFSAFDFENYMQVIKRIIRKKGQKLQQIHRRLTERSKFQKPLKIVDKNYPVMQQPANKKLPKDCHSCHRSLKFKNFELKDERPNNCCITKNNNLIIIERICIQNNEEIVVACEFLGKDDIPYCPLSISRNLGICEVKNLSEKKIFLVKEINSKACLFLHQGKSYVLPLLHH